MSLGLRPIGSVLGRAATKKRLGANVVSSKPDFPSMIWNVISLCERGAIHILTLLDALWLTDASQLVVTGRLTVEEVAAKRISSSPYNRKLSIAYQKYLKMDIIHLRKLIPKFAQAIKKHQDKFKEASLGYYNDLIAKIQSKLTDLREQRAQIREESNDNGIYWISMGYFIYNNCQREIFDYEAELSEIQAILRNLIAQNVRSQRWFMKGLAKLQRIYALDVQFYNRIVREIPFEMQVVNGSTSGLDPPQGSSSKPPTA